MRRLWLGIGIIFLGGCLVRTYTLEKSRVDTDIGGNRGYLIGSPKEKEKTKKKLSETRKITVIEIEFGPHRTKEIRHKEKEREEVEKEEISERVFSEEEKPEEELVKNTEEKKEVFSIPQIEVEPKFHLYVIQENDTLEKISYKFYGTVRKWRLIYEANKDVLKRSDRIYPGIEIKIPILEKEE
ncbi:MAG TPA: LysM peptidoglycan-binding domain-containing protein [Candidatus Omnitrophica bacterium]|nr:LysM peptidoglycan-binding domain-containing protein [Candidatus Omnitrophota bacterium]